jgi:L-2-hydroxycarboxylate dehydrogenase (NAD+)
LVWLERKDKGVPFNDNLKATIIKLRDEMGLNQYKFSFE